jgi:hypothetical protein
MSIVDSKVDLEQAQARLAEATAEQLIADLGFWSMACLDTSAEYVDLAERQLAAQQRYAEAQQWTTLIAKELRSRRDAKTADRPPAQD